MTIVTKGMGAVIKKFGKKTAKHMADTKARHKAWKKMGLKGPKYRVGKKVKGSHHLDEVWTYDKNYRTKKAIGGILKGIGKGISKRMTGSHKPKKGGWQDMDRPKAISEEKKPDWEFKADRAEKQKIDKQLNVAKNVGKGIAVAVPGSYAYGKWKRHKRDKEKKRTKKSIGGILKGIGKIVKGPANKWRMEQAKNLKKHRLRTKIEKARAGRLQSKVKTNLDKKIASNPDLKKAVSQQRHPKSWRRHQQKGTK